MLLQMLTLGHSGCSSTCRIRRERATHVITEQMEENDRAPQEASQADDEPTVMLTTHCWLAVGSN